MKKFKNILHLPKKTKRTIYILIVLLFFVLVYYGLQMRLLLITVRPEDNPPINIASERITDSISSSGIALPLKLKITSLDIDANIQYVGLNSEGLMNVPTNYTDVAWYQAGSRPGEIGSAVIAGHYGTKDSAFNNLSKLKIGDEVIVRNAEGNNLSFIVNKIEKYEANDNASSIFFSADGLAHLNLVTCMGTWNKITKSYPSRLIIFTTMK